MHDPDDLTDAEREALAALPRARTPSPLLEERTVRALRSRGLLSARSALPHGWRITAAAAAIALFAGGTAFGQWLGTRQTVDAVAAARGDDLSTALQLQQAGTAYLDALAALVQAPAGGDAESARQAREVAFAVYRGASEEIERLQNLERGDTTEVGHVIWF